MRFAELVKEQTPPRSLVIHAPVHNTPVFLTGRRSLMGYPGHIWTHGLEFVQREGEIKRIYLGSPDADQLMRNYGVEYAVVGPHERMVTPINEAFFTRFRRLEKLVSTGSTKSGKKNRVKTHPAETDNPRGGCRVPLKTTFRNASGDIGVIGIFVIAAILRLYDLNLVPLHHDEGVNGNFLVRLVREGAYQYDPENYHGPTLYYFSALIPWITKLLFGAAASDTYGLTTFTIRLVPVVFGLATIGLVFLLRRKLGTVATLAAGLMLAVSPGAVYLSRYFIHETLFVFFTLGIVVAAVWFYEERNPSYLIPAGASAALLFATKETALISAGVLIIALALTLIYVRLNRKAFAPPRRNETGREVHQARLKTVLDEMGGTASVVVAVDIGAYQFSWLFTLLFYSSFFQNSKGIYDSFETFAIWRKTGTSRTSILRSCTSYWLVEAGGAAVVPWRRSARPSLF